MLDQYRGTKRSKAGNIGPYVCVLIGYENTPVSKQLGKTDINNCTFGSSNIVSASAWFITIGITFSRKQGTKLSESNVKRQLAKSANKQ